jgi:hypothetical protein
MHQSRADGTWAPKARAVVKASLSRSEPTRSSKFIPYMRYIFNAQGGGSTTHLQRIGGKPSVTWTLKSPRVYSVSPRLSRGCVRLCVRGVGGWRTWRLPRRRSNSEQYTRHGTVVTSTTRVNACHNVSTRQPVPSILFCPVGDRGEGGAINENDASHRQTARSGFSKFGLGKNVACQATDRALSLSHSHRAPRRARSGYVAAFIVRAAPWRHARCHAAPAVPRPCAAQPSGFCNLGRSRKARGALP